MPADYYFGEASTRLRLEREERERQAAAKRAALAAQLGPALQAAERGDVEGMREVVRLLALKHDITIEVRTEMPSGASAYAIWRANRIVIRPVDDADTFAEALHETGHILAGECTGKEPHRPDKSVTRWHHCIACETDAWTEAMKLAPFSREMFSRLQQSLRTYRRTTPAAAAEINRLDRVAGTVNWAMQHTARKKMRDREESLARWKQQQSQWR